MVRGSVPYRAFSDEYPPLAQPVFLLGRVAGASNFALAFKALMALCGVGALCCAVLTLRALRVLRDCDLIACEDTRHTRRLLDHYAGELETARRLGD